MRHAFPTSVDRLYQFSGFVVDPVIGQLHHGDQEVRLTQKAFAVLIALIEHHGEVIARRELKERVWPGTAVDENNLTQCISMLRKAFYERQPQTEFIATVLGQGYRFVPAVTEVEREALGHHALDAAPSMVSAPPDIAHSADSRATRRTAVRASVAIAAGSLLIASGWWLARPKEFALHNTAAAHVAERKLWRLTSASRLETEPSWSPDGRFLVYSSDRSGNLDIWVQAVDGIATRVTSSQAPESYPAWSPDGRLIAFTREGTGAGIFVVRAAGGPEKQIADFGARPQWSADGLAILFYSSARPGRREGFLVGLDGSVPRAVPTPIPGMQLVGLAWHPDGRLSVFGTKPTGDQVFLTMTLDGRQTVISSIAAAVAMRVKEAELTLGDFVWAPTARRSTSTDVRASPKTSGESRWILRPSCGPTAPSA